MSETVSPSPYIIDVTDQSFTTDVLEKSKTVPVVVDFWAEWCGPCRALGPVLERLTSESKGAFILAKVDVDQNQQIAHQFHIQGIPAVKAFYNGQVVGEFTGAQPEPKVREFLQNLLPSQADAYAKQAYEWEVSGKLMMAEANYRGALEEDPKHLHAMVGLGRVLLQQGKTEEGITLLQRIPSGGQERQAADALIATAQFMSEATGQDEAALRANLNTAPNDVPTHYSLACLLATQENYQEAFDHFLEVIRRDRAYKDDAARKAMLALFTILGEGHDLSKSYRRKLANALF
ncbi:co-chaperone YbbN [Anaerolineales bacterium HSG25]|nr:co-chaperone YbbN [Anaerolineales bacterium HSG25]